MALKTTQRLIDYPVIGQLVLRCLERADEPGPEDLEWAVANVYTIEDLGGVLASHAEAFHACRDDRVLHEYAVEWRRDVQVAGSTRDAVEHFLA